MDKKKMKGQVNPHNIGCATDKNDLKENLLEDCSNTVWKDNKPTPSRSMGIGPLGSPTTTFVRKFRWTMGSSTLPEHFFKNVKFDYIKKQINFEYYNIATPEDGLHAMKWVENLNPQEILTFTTFDGCGNKIYEEIFHGLSVVEHSNDFNYESSDASFEKISVLYSFYERNYLFKTTVPTLSFTNQVEVEEVNINFLNSNIKIPGKTLIGRLYE